ncbi:MAG: hypothetical protein HY335_08215 [Deinococcus sp.]|nr:hypothetical protein [Deinococcus sp.]
MSIPLAPSLPLAIGLLLARHLLAQMDVPARQAYTVAVVDPEERTAAAAVTSLVRQLAQAAGPTLAGLALGSAALGLPFFLGGGLKVVYDLLLYANFRQVPPVAGAPQPKPATSRG